MTLTPAAYDRAEALAEQGLPNRLIQACRPALFNHIGYPTRAESLGALWRWADAMHEGRFEADFAELLGGGLTEQEWVWWREITLCVARLTNGTPVAPRGALARATAVLRTIQARAKAPALVVEVGPGSGYLSALLGLAGYSVYAVENAQAFYLWQARFLSALLGERFVDMAQANGRGDHAGRVVHVPWWHFYRLDPQPLDQLPVDLVVANHVLCEMHRDASAYLIQRCVAWSADLLIDGYGAETLNGSDGVQSLLKRHGIKPVALDAPSAAQARPVALAQIEAPPSRDEIWWRMLHGPGHHG